MASNMKLVWTLLHIGIGSNGEKAANAAKTSANYPIMDNIVQLYNFELHIKNQIDKK